MPEILQFSLDVGAALLMGVALGLERQYFGHPAGLRTNALVCVGAALFVSLSGLMKNTNTDPTRIASYIVSGIGFLGGGVILREGFTVRGMNTAATLWCSAAVGTLAGAGFALYALLGTVAVLAIHIGLRPIADWVDRRRKLSPVGEVSYRFRVLCEDKDEGLIRTILLRHVNAHPKMTVHGITTEDSDGPGKTMVVVDIFSLQRNERALEDLVNRINIEPSVKSVSWDKRP
jgi:putative Mg2+ transporter-C (MgtC) family protein